MVLAMWWADALRSMGRTERLKEFHRLCELKRRQLSDDFVKKHGRPKHDALVARIAAHKQEIRELRRGKTV